MPFSAPQKKILRQLGSNIRSLRERQGLSQEKLAEKCDLHRTYISDVERGERNISFINLMKIIKTLEARIEDVFQHIEG